MPSLLLAFWNVSSVAATAEAHLLSVTLTSPGAGQVDHNQSTCPSIIRNARGAQHQPRTALHQGICTHLPRRVGGMHGPYGHGLDRFFTCTHRACCILCICKGRAMAFFGVAGFCLHPFPLGDQGGCGSGTRLSTALVFVHCGTRNLGLDCGAFFVDAPMGCLV